MQISNDAYLAVECLVQLRSCTRERPGKTLWLARSINRSVSYTEAIMSRLRRAGFVEAKKGSGGGYYLSRPAEAIAIDEVFQAFDQPTTPERLSHVARRNGNGHAQGNGNGHGNGNGNGNGTSLDPAGLVGMGCFGGHGANGGNGHDTKFAASRSNGHPIGSSAVVSGSNQLWEDLREYVLMVLAEITIADIGAGDPRARSVLAKVSHAQAQTAETRRSCHPCAPQRPSPDQPCRPA